MKQIDGKYGAKAKESKVFSSIYIIIIKLTNFFPDNLVKRK